jgi:hypothetical protein
MWIDCYAAQTSLSSADFITNLPGDRYNIDQAIADHCEGIGKPAISTEGLPHVHSARRALQQPRASGREDR